MSAYDRWKTAEAEDGVAGPDSESHAAAHGNDQRVELAWPAEEMAACDGVCRGYLGASTHAEAHRIANLVERLVPMVLGADASDLDKLHALDSERRLGGCDPARELLEALAIALDTAAQAFHGGPGDGARRKQLESASAVVEAAQQHLVSK